MYSDLHVKQIPVRSLAVGDKLDFSFRITQQRPEIPGELWGQENFGSGVVFLERSIELHVPRQKQVTVWSPEHTPDISEAADERVYRCKGSQLRPSSAKEDDDAPKDDKPHIAWTTFPSWEAVGLWYRALIAGRDTVTPAIQAKADSLTANAKTDTEKVRLLYDYVSTRNHYIGVGLYQTHMAAEVLTNQYGDCKDKHTLLAALLHAQGFKVAAVLIGAGIEMNEKVPMPTAFNHLITLVDVDGDKVWLDATTEVAPYRALMSVLRDKQALVVPQAGTPELVKTPALLPYAPLTHYETASELDKSGSLKGHVEITMRGDDEILCSWRLATLPAHSGISSARTTPMAMAFAAPPARPYLTPPTIPPAPGACVMTMPPALTGIGTHIASLLPNVVLPVVDEKKPPKKEIDLGSPHTALANSTIHLPQGYSVELPDAIHLKAAFATLTRATSSSPAASSRTSDLRL